MAGSLDLSKLGRLLDTLHKLGSVSSRISRRVSSEIGATMDQQFGNATDPYGRPWKEHVPATVKRWGPHPILQLTQAMRASLDVRPLRPAGVGITIDHPAGPHQTGWSGKNGTGPARPILPSRGMPAKWAAIIRAAAADEIKKRAA